MLPEMKRMRVPASLLIALMAWAAPERAAAQGGTAVDVGVGVGGTYYCIMTRCNTGTLLSAGAALRVNRFVFVEAGARRHLCFDCDRFIVVDAMVAGQYPFGTWTPFAGAGWGVASDPEFMGREDGLHAAAGTWIRPGNGAWSIQLALRGRQVGGDAMGELSAMVTRRVFGR